ncbi:response regulator [Spirosoma sp. KCTC 42546]|uniref:sigma 54-interacting transcriptional regulator n=1 Tax=Spirosoma sp. KCTC 42546 TaxID=2520506 RepID=UPI00115C3C4B|nr:sigma 54-interacting transcriptional regulator [Spirosoma sp. KCTC 42546]QDK77535.1 response regulator [Spirosoma sp. KCTC 42546]
MPTSANLAVAGKTVNPGARVLIVEDELLIADNLEDILLDAGYTVVGIAVSVQEAQDLLADHQPDLVLLDIYLKGGETSLDFARTLRAQHIPFIYISANANDGVLHEIKATQPYGYIVKPFRSKDILYTLEIAFYRHAHSLEQKLREEKMLQISLTNALSEVNDWVQKLLNVATCLQPFIPFDLITLSLDEGKTTRSCSFFRIGLNEYQTIHSVDFLRMTGLTAQKYDQLRAELPPLDGISLLTGNEYAESCQRFRLTQIIAKTFSLQANLLATLSTTQGSLFTVSFYSRQPDAYLPDHVSLLERLQQSVRLTLERLLAFDEIARLNEQLGRENKYLQEEVKTTASFNEIVGTSPKLHHVFKQVEKVAPTDATVLLMGESGTGKELFARAIHTLSSRKDKLLVKVNCATLPMNLIESELFGHEKGAFTGAAERRIGKFELAHQGTIFLDEIGEMPLDLQAKLLRVLQEKEFERLGGKGTIQTDVRVIAATNRHLEKEVAEGRFRLDLYYRLSVFPILLPALRERPEDIPLLAHFFAQKYSQKMGKSSPGISSTTLAELLSYAWPGNIRELENIIEQAVIISDGLGPLTLGRSLANNWIINNPSSSHPSINDPVNKSNQVPTPITEPKTLSDVKSRHEQTERDYILSVLIQTNGKIRGKGGAAELLGLKPTTLEYRMEKLGIKSK